MNKTVRTILIVVTIMALFCGVVGLLPANLVNSEYTQGNIFSLFSAPKNSPALWGSCVYPVQEWHNPATFEDYFHYCVPGSEQELLVLNTPTPVIVTPTHITSTSIPTNTSIPANTPTRVRRDTPVPLVTLTAVPTISFTSVPPTVVNTPVKPTIQPTKIPNTPIPSTAIPLARCSDGRDNDHDGYTDWPEDPECSSANDSSEAGGGSDDD